MTTLTRHRPLRAITYNLLLGGLDAGNDDRLRAQIEMLVGMVPSRVRRIPSPPNLTVLLIRPSTVRLMDWWSVGEGVFHHALIMARLRPVAAGDNPNADFLVFGTHYSWADGNVRLRESRMVTDYGGPFPGVPRGALLLGDLNTPDREPNWADVPRNLQSRYRIVKSDGTFGHADRRAVQVLLQSGWTDPQKVIGDPEAASVGYKYDNEKVPLRLDYALVSGLEPTGCFIHDTDEALYLSDHLPGVLDVKVMAGAQA